MTRMLCRLLVVLMVWTPFHVAQAAMIGTDQIAVASVQSDRAAVMNALSRSDVSGQLQALGIDPATAKDRVAAMSDQEVASLAGKLNALPAGGDSAGAVLLILLVVLVWWLVK